ncbi:MAG: hypothetical protein Q9226_009052, partial [Calogaya cf. arnoldii]
NDSTVYGHALQANEAAAISQTVDAQFENFLRSDGSSVPQTNNTNSDQSNSTNADGEQYESAGNGDNPPSNEAAIQDRQNDGEQSDSSMDISSGNEPTTQPNGAMTDSQNHPEGSNNPSHASEQTGESQGHLMGGNSQAENDNSSSNVNDNNNANRAMTNDYSIQTNHEDSYATPYGFRHTGVVYLVWFFRHGPEVINATGFNPRSTVGFNTRSIVTHLVVAPTQERANQYLWDWVRFNAGLRNYSTVGHWLAPDGNAQCTLTGFASLLHVSVSNVDTIV